MGLKIDQDYLRRLKKEAAAGDPHAQYELAQFYRNWPALKAAEWGAFLWFFRRNWKSKGYDRLYVSWLEKAAEHGHVVSMLELANLYQNGKYVEKDEAKASTYLLQAAEKGSSEALYLMGVRYENGIGVDANPSESIARYTQAAEMGHPDAQYLLGYKLLNGSGVDRDEKQGVAWLTRAAKQGHPSAIYEMGHCCRRGVGTEQNLEEAIMWYTLAARKWEPARRDLEDCYSEWFSLKQSSAHTDPWFLEAKGNGADRRRSRFLREEFP